MERMGLYTAQIIKIMQMLKTNGTQGKTLAMLGKQALCTKEDLLLKILLSFGIFNEKKDKDNMIDSVQLFKMMGLKEVHVLDYSDYEGADIICDLNKELPLDLYQRFDYIIEGGTFEHVFDIAQAMENVSNMLKVGGIVYHGSPSDGWINHGFYSISPNFFMDYYFNNGFDIISIEMQMEYEDKSSDRIICNYSEDLRTFRTEEEINRFFRKNMLQEEFHAFQVICIARKKIVQKLEYPIQGRYAEAYMTKQSNITSLTLNKSKVKEYLKNCHGKIALFGCGYMCDAFMDEVYRNDRENKIDFIFDSNIRKAGMVYRGFKIFYPVESKLCQVKDIMITSTRYEKDIKDFLIDKGIEEDRIKMIRDLCK